LIAEIIYRQSNPSSNSLWLKKALSEIDLTAHLEGGIFKYVST
jgi:hypothetical protein